MKNCKAIIGIIPTLLSLVLLWACPPLVDQGIMDHVNDKILPVISIESPVITPGKSALCANIATVRGRAKDFSTANGDAGEIRSLVYEVTGTSVCGNIELQADGNFSFSFITTALANDFTLLITGWDWNKNKVEKKIDFKKAENGIPGFSITPGNKKVILQWDDIQHTSSYTIYFTNGEAQPTENYGTVLSDAKSPYTIDWLTNGNLYTFQLKANPESGWPVSSSDCLTAIPLSERTLVPQVRGEYQEIHVSWNSIPGTNTFEVWRSLYIDSEFVKIKTLTGTSYVDHYPEIMKGQWYYYKIRPYCKDNNNSLLSAVNGAETSPFPDKFNIVNTGYFSKYHPKSSHNSIVLSGLYAFMICEGDSFSVMDLTHPIYPSTLFRDDPLVIPGANSMAIAGNYAFVTCGSFGLTKVNIENIYSPSIDKTIEGLPIEPFDITIDGSYAYLASGHTIVAVDLDTLDQVQDWIIPDVNINRLVAADHYLYALDATNNAIFVFDTHDLTTYINKINIPADNLSYNLTISGSLAYVSDLTPNLYIIDITDPLQAGVINTVPLEGYSEGILVTGPFAYVLNHKYGVNVLDVSQPRNARIIDTLPMAYNVFQLITSGNYVYAFGCDFSDNYYIHVIDNRTPAVKPKLIQQLAESGELNGEARACAIFGYKAYVYTAGSNNLNIINLDNCHYGTVAGKIGNIPNFGYRLSVSGNYAYLACGWDGLKIVDVSHLHEANEEAVVYTIPAPGFVYDVTVSGDYAYVSMPNAGISIIDISDPATASVIKTIPTPDLAFGIALSGSYLYVGNDKAGVQIIDVTEPLNSSIVNMLNYGKNIQFIAALPPFVYVKEFNYSLRIIASDDPLNKNPASRTLEVVGDICQSGIAFSGNYIYFCLNKGNSCEINFINNKKPFTSSAIKAIELEQITASNIAVSGTYAYVTAGSNGLQIIRLTDYY